MLMLISRFNYAISCKSLLSNYYDWESIFKWSISMNTVCTDCDFNFNYCLLQILKTFRLEMNIHTVEKSKKKLLFVQLYVILSSETSVSKKLSL